MAFLFASSHLPVVRSRRPADEEEEEEPADPQTLPRSGMVRAISHLPQAAPADAGDPAGALSLRGARPAGGRQPQRVGPEGPGTPHEQGVAAAKASGLFDVIRDHYNRGNGPHVMDEDGNLRPRTETHLPDYPAPAPAAAHEDTTPWHTPPITHADLRALLHDEPEGARGTENGSDDNDSHPAPRVRRIDHDPDPGFSHPAPEEWGKPTRDAGFDNVHAEDLGPGTRDAGFDFPPQDMRRALRDSSDNSTGSGNAGYRDAATGQPRGMTDKAEFNDLLYRPQGSPEEQGDQRRGLLQHLASTPQQLPASVPTAPENPSKSKPTKKQSEDRPLGYKEKKTPPPPRMVFDEVGPWFYGNPADLSSQASSLGLDYSKQANPTLAQIRERTRALGKGDIYVYSGHGGRVDNEPFLAAHGEADTSKQEVPISYDRKTPFGTYYKQAGTGYSVGQLKDDISQSKNGVPMMVFVSGCEVGATDMSKLNDAGVSMVVSAGGKAGERDAPIQMKTFMDVLTKGGTINDALKTVNEVVDRDNRSKFDEKDMQEPFTAVFKNGINGDSTLEDLRRHNARINEERKAGMKKAGRPVP